MNIYITRDFYLLRITNYAVYIVRIRKIVWILSIVVVFIIVNFSTSNCQSTRTISYKNWGIASPRCIIINRRIG